jgi:hypothetical protein
MLLGESDGRPPERKALFVFQGGSACNAGQASVAGSAVENGAGTR